MLAELDELRSSLGGGEMLLEEKSPIGVVPAGLGVDDVFGAHGADVDHGPIVVDANQRADRRPGWARLIAVASTDPSSPNIPLLADLANPREVAGATFDQLAAAYDTARPGYPPKAMSDLRTRCRLGPASAVLEIGCGTGQATRGLAPNVGVIRCIEPGVNLAARARKNLSGFPNAEVVVTTFEEDVDPGTYDAVVSATAFHWVDPTVAFPRAAQALRPRGSIALLTNVHARGGTESRLASDFRDLHVRLAPDVGPWTFPTVADVEANANGGGDMAAVWSRVERKFAAPSSVAHLFEAPEVSTYPWVAAYDTTSYLMMLSTQSSYALMDPARRDELFGEMGRLVETELGGGVTKQYLTILATAQRSAG